MSKFQNSFDRRRFLQAAAAGAIATIPVGAVAGSASAAAPRIRHPRATTPVCGTNREAPWATVSSATGGLAGYRGYNTAATGIPTSWPGPGSAPIPAGATLSAISIKPDIDAVLSGSLDDALTAFARLVPAGAMITCWAEGERANEEHTASQIVGLHEHVYPIFKAASPNCLYGQTVTTYSATNGRLTSFVVPGLDYYGLDCYPVSDTDTPAANLGAAVSQIEAAGASGPWAIMELNSQPGNRADWFNSAWAWAKSVNALTFLTYWGADPYAWDPSDTETIDALTAINTESKG